MRNTRWKNHAGRYKDKSWLTCSIHAGRGGFAPQGPPDQVYEMGTFMHASEGEMVCTSTNVKIPYFNAPIYLENKTAVGKVDEILGPINQVYFTIKPQEGIVATSFKNGDKFYIGGDKLLPLERYAFSRQTLQHSPNMFFRFLPKPKPAAGAPKVKKPAGRGGRGGFGAPRGRGSFGGGDRGRGAVSYTHLTLPTIYSV